jgi:hypothetical membrane protein
MNVGGAGVSQSMSSSHGGRQLLLGAVVGIILYFVLDALAQSLPPHYSPLSQAESDLAVGPFGYIMAVNFVNRGVLSLLFLLGFSRAVKPSSGYRYGYYLVGLWALGSMVLAAFPTDVSGTPTLHGAIHLVVAIFAFLGGVFGELVLSRGLRNDPSLARLGNYCAVIATFAFVSLAALFLGPGVAPRAFSGISGLVERVFIGLVLFWILLVSAKLSWSTDEARSQ